VISPGELESARAMAAALIHRAGVPMRSDEPPRIEAADFGLGHLEIEGAQILTVAESPRLAVKLIALFPGQTLPEHWHPMVGDDPGKEETIRVQWGSMAIFAPGAGRLEGWPPPAGKEAVYSVREGRMLAAGDQYYLPPGTRHWFQGGLEGAVVWSFSSVARDVLDRFTDPAVVRTTVVKPERP